MHKFFVDSSNIIDNNVTIIGDDVKHIYKVLRLSVGDDVAINDCNGNEFLGKLEDINKKEVKVKILEKLETSNESPVKISLYQGMPKGSKMDLIVQKGTEIGVSKFQPIITKRVDVAFQEYKKLDRLKKIILEACKQSKRSIIPTISEPINFEKTKEELKEYDLIVVPYERADGYGIKSLSMNIKREDIKNIAIVIGPEGGFEEDEIEELKEIGAEIVTLGKRILRTETAGFVATSLLCYELGDMGGSVR